MQDFDKYKKKGAYHYDWYETEDWYRKCVDRCVEFCKGKTLDVGCGDGVVLNLLNDPENVGFDNSPEAIKLCKKRGLNAYLHDVSEPILGKYDYMVCLNVIEHLENPERIKEIFNRNITKAAIIITDEPQEHPSSHHIKEFTPYELKQMFHTRKVIPFRIDENFHGIEVYK